MAHRSGRLSVSAVPSAFLNAYLAKNHIVEKLKLDGQSTVEQAQQMSKNGEKNRRCSSFLQYFFFYLVVVAVL